MDDAGDGGEFRSAISAPVTAGDSQCSLDSYKELSDAFPFGEGSESLTAASIAQAAFDADVGLHHMLSQHEIARLVTCDASLRSNDVWNNSRWPSNTVTRLVPRLYVSSKQFLCLRPLTIRHADGKAAVPVIAARGVGASCQLRARCAPPTIVSTDNVMEDVPNKPISLAIARLRDKIGLAAGHVCVLPSSSVGRAIVTCVDMLSMTTSADSGTADQCASTSYRGKVSDLLGNAVVVVSRGVARTVASFPKILL